MLQDALITWFEKEQRALPWRENYDPYQVWISEIMLQQTQVTTVLPYFERFIKTLPTVQDLAAVDEELLLKLWEGLGYYSRARNLKKAAQLIVEKHQGVFPQTHESILGLPGIGRYTAGAICSIAFEQDEALVDGNVIRVLSRLDDYREDSKKNVEHFWSRARELLPKGKARDFNQGLMELGALICTPKKPKCETCPLNKDCKALAAGTVELLPIKGPAPSKIKIQVAVAILERDGKVFVQKRHEKGLMGGLWEFPGGKVEKGESLEAALKRELWEETRFTLKNIRPFVQLQHAYTRYLVELHCFLAEPLESEFSLSAASEARWVNAEELRNIAFPAANVKILEKYLKRGKTE